MRDKQRCVAEVDKNLYLYEKLKAVEENQRLKMAKEQAIQKLLIVERISMKGAGGTQGGTGQFFMGLAMMCGGFYLLFNAIQVSSSFGLGYGLYRVNAFGQGMSITTGMVMLPFIIGIVMVFFDAKSKLAWLLSLGSLTALVVGVISSIQFHFKSMSAFELIVILVLAFGGLGVFLRSLKDAPTSDTQAK